MNSSMRLIAALLCCGLLGACASTWVSRDWKKGDEELSNGIVYYESEPFLATYKFFAYAKEDKSTTTECTPTVQKYEILYERGQKRVLISKPSQWSSTSFAVTLNTNGTLASINTATTPVAEQAVAAVLTAAASAAVVFKAAGKPSCNAAAVITSWTHIDDFGHLPFERPPGG